MTIYLCLFFFFNDTATTEIYTLSLHDALPIYLTNELLTANAKNLREANKVVREEMERGVFDIEAVKTANAELVATIEESLQIADDGKAKRAAAEVELQKMETELRDTLAAAKSRKTGTGDTIGTAAG